MSKKINILVAVIMVILLLWGCNFAPPPAPPLLGGEQNTEVQFEEGEAVWYPQHEVFVTYQSDTFRVVAVNIDRRLGMISKGKRQIVRTLDSLKAVE